MTHTLLRPGRKQFHEGLREVCNSLLASCVHYQWTHTEYLSARDSRLFVSRAWAQATVTARGEALAYLRGGIEMLHYAQVIVWRHMDPQTGLYTIAEYREGIDPDKSRHVWASTGKVFFAPSAEVRS